MKEKQFILDYYQPSGQDDFVNPIFSPTTSHRAHINDDITDAM